LTVARKPAVDPPDLYGHQFTCRDCLYDVYSFGVVPVDQGDPLCALCRWLAEFGADIPEAEKQRLRNREVSP
jgi:hypothetical protein